MLSAIVGYGLFALFHALSAVWSFARAAASRIVPDKDRAPRRLPHEPRFLSVGEHGVSGLERLPVVPPIPPHIRTVAIAGCANLAMYTFGAAYALQRAPNYAERLAEGSLVASGGSSGAFVAAPLAMGIDCGRVMLRLCHTAFVRHRRRFGGCVGIFSQSVRGILAQGLAEARRRGDDPLAKLAPGDMPGDTPGDRLRVSVTRFAPQPEHVVVSGFASEAELLDAVLASCYIPVAYESPVVLPRHGFCIDGCALRFLPAADLVISPYHVHLAEATPRAQYPSSMVFNLLHASDILRLFEDGYLDTVRWLEEGGGASRDAERRAKAGAAPIASSMRALVAEGVGVALEIAGFSGGRSR